VREKKKKIVGGLACLRSVCRLVPLVRPRSFVVMAASPRSPFEAARIGSANIAASRVRLKLHFDPQLDTEVPTGRCWFLLPSGIKSNYFCFFSPLDSGVCLLNYTLVFFFLLLQ
jgi:hypothetical protein